VVEPGVDVVGSSVVDVVVGFSVVVVVDVDVVGGVSQPDTRTPCASRRRLRPVVVDRQLHVSTLLGMRLEVLQHRPQVVGLRSIETGLGTAATVVVLADEDVVLEEDHRLARRGWTSNVT
jgi:hypothetical protein